MKKVLLTFIFIFALILSACDSTEPVPSNTPEPSPTAEIQINYFDKYSPDILKELIRLFQADIRFWYKDIDADILKGTYTVTPAPYKNIDTSEITCLDDIFVLASKEVPEASENYRITHVSCDIDDKLWKVEFESEYLSPYCVILNSEGVTKIVLTQYSPIGSKLLKAIRAEAPSTFLYADLEDMFSTNQATPVTPPYKNTEKSEITSLNSIIDIARMEISEYYTSVIVSYDEDTKYWNVEFDSEEMVSPYNVVLNSDGITKKIYTRYSPIKKNVLDTMLGSGYFSFSYSNFEQNTPKEKILPPPYKNTKQVKIKSFDDLFALFDNEALDDEHTGYTLLYDDVSKYWQAIFLDGNDFKLYTVTLSSEGVTKMVTDERSSKTKLFFENLPFVVR